MNSIALGERIRLRRENLGLSQAALSEKAGISPQHMSRLECGQKVPRLETLLALALALDTSTDMLLNGIPSSQSQLDTLLADCSDTEKNVIMDTAQALKQSLRRHT